MAMKKILSVLKKEKIDNTPIWMMRQAGRHLPEYLEIRSKQQNFLSFCYDVEKATEVTIQPVKRYDVDAAILFSDILVLPDLLGWVVSFKKGEGPVLKQLVSEKCLDSLTAPFSKNASCVYQIISNLRNQLQKEKTLIGFAGSPWTVATYMIEGRGKQDFSLTKKLIFNDRPLAIKLIDILTERTIEHLSNQVEAGVDVVQLFDSWAGVISGEYYQEFVINPTKKIVTSLKEKYPQLPIIGFPRGSGYNYEEYIKQTGVDGVSVDQFIPVNKMLEWESEVVVQGNIEPVVLLSDNQDVIKRHVDNVLEKMYGKNFIFNLGHGVLPSTPIKNVEFLVNYVKSFKQ